MMNSKLLKSFAYGIRPDGKFSIEDWSKDNVPLLNSKKASHMDLSQTPWLREPLQTIIDGDYDHTNCIMATGSGKSSMALTLATFHLIEKPSQVAYFLPTAPLAQNFMEATLLPSWKKNPKASALFPANRHAAKKDVILFPHMTFYCRGMSIANTQSISVDLILVDEAWLAENDALTYAQRRLHDRYFSQSVFVSQAGNTDSDFYDWCKDTITKEFQYKCPKCEQYHSWKFENLKWNSNFSDVHYECPCGEKFQDTPQNRRAFSSNGKYIDLPTVNANPKKITYIFNAGMNHSVEWTKLAREFVKANEEAKKFNFEPLKVFRNQRLSQWWSESEIEFVPVEKSFGYSINDKKKDELTLLAIDVQGQLNDTLMWYAVRTFNKTTGESRLLDFGRFASYEDIPRKQLEWGLVGNQVAIDAAWKTDEVREFAAIHGYLTLNGVNTNVFPVNVKGKNVNRIYGTIRKEKTLKGRFASYAPYSSTRCKVVCAGLRSSKTWSIPHDCPDFYVKQLNAEVYQDGKWIQKAKDNHALDIDSMLLVLALVHGVNIIIQEEKEEE